MRRVVAIFLLAAVAAHAAEVDPSRSEVTEGAIRVRALTDTLVRLEQRGPDGFEDRPTLQVVRRDWPGGVLRVSETPTTTVLDLAAARVLIPKGATTLAAVTVESFQGTPLYRFEDAELARAANSVDLPEPAHVPPAWHFADWPRLVPPANAAAPREKWDTANGAPDVYLFLSQGDYGTLRRDFLRLTGPTEMPPLYAFGAFDSRWHPYSETEALARIDAFRDGGFPLDVLVIDADWRTNGGYGYMPKRALFPDLGRFVAAAHDRHVHLLFNDHPEPRVADDALDPAEIAFRTENLARMLNDGVDAWWYDRNWDFTLPPLDAPGHQLRGEVWGMRLYHDITEAARPAQRPWLMANYDGIDNGVRHRPANVSAHRFAIQWTGDIPSGWNSLAREVANMLDVGVHGPFPYLSCDLGGFYGASESSEGPGVDLTPELFVRWMQYGALSPVYRPHAVTYDNEDRAPWTRGQPAARIVRDYVRLRYRLLPLLYAGARRNYDTGEPLMRRLDLVSTDFPRAAVPDEYLIGDDLLVAPITEPGGRRTVWLPTGTWTDTWTGAVTRGPREIAVVAPMDRMPLFVRAHAVIPTAPQMAHTAERPWNPMLLDVAGDLLADGIVYTGAELYEDDGVTVAYRAEDARRTSVTISSFPESGLVRVAIDAARGHYDGAPDARAWTIRLRRPAGWTLASVKVQDQALPNPALTPRVDALPFGDPAGAPDADVYDVKLPELPVNASAMAEIRFVAD